VEGYADATYGERLADVYDAWYQGGDGADAMVAFVEQILEPTPGRILELAVGTGRLALRLARRGHDVTGVDVSPAMLERLAAADPDRTVRVLTGDMVDDLPPGPFDVVLVADNSLFLLADPVRQAACFRAVAGVLATGGAFVVEAFVPAEPPPAGPVVAVRSMTADQVVLSVSVTDPQLQTVDGQHVELRHGAPVVLRPFRLRYSTPTELDTFAAAARLELTRRSQDVAGTAFDAAQSPSHVSVYRHISATGEGG
jgi:SAM-dependent methyltransferase